MESPTTSAVRQGSLFESDSARVPTPEERAKSDMLALISELKAATAHPWTERGLRIRCRTFELLGERISPLEAAVLKTEFEEELARLGQPAKPED